MFGFGSLALPPAGSGRSNPAALFESSVAVLGDSRAQDGVQPWKSASSSDWKGLTIGSGFCGPAITADASGSLEYRASDQSLRWTAPGDTAGPWTAMAVGWQRFESGSADKYLDVGIRSMSGLPGTDQTITVLCSGTMRLGWLAYGAASRFLNINRWLQPRPIMLGIGGNTTANAVEQIGWVNEQAPGPGWDVFHGPGTNDITASVASGTIIANLTAIYEARRAQGRRLLIIGESARWGADTSTPLDSTQIGILDDVRAFQSAYAGAHSSEVQFLDAYLLTYDSGQTDRRPAAGMLRDTVHLYERGAQIIGQAAADLMASVIGYGPQLAAGSAENLLAVGDFSGSDGTAGTGASGTVPTGWTVSRASGSDATVAVSVEARADGVAGNWIVLECLSTSAGIIQAQCQTANVTLAALGLAVGDEVYIEAEVLAADMAAVKNIEFFTLFSGVSPATSLRANLEMSGAPIFGAEHSVMRVGPVKIPAGTTGLATYFWLKLNASGAANVRIASARIVKV